MVKTIKRNKLFFCLGLMYLLVLAT